MRKIISAVLLTLAGTVPASAVQVWQGGVFLNSVTAACSTAPYNWHNFEYPLAVYRPRSIENNGASDILMVFADRHVQQFIALNTSLNAATTLTGRMLTGAGAYRAFTATPSAVTITPSPIGAATPAVHLNATIDNWANIAGCTVTLKGSLTLRPDL